MQIEFMRRNQSYYVFWVIIRDIGVKVLKDYLWFVFALLSAVAASFVAIFGKIGLKDIDSNTATAVRAIVMAVFLVLVVLLQGNIRKIPDIVADKKAFIWIVLSGIAGATSWLFYFLALKHGKVSQVVPIDKLSVVLSTLFAVLLLKESISPLGIVGVILITLGGIAVALG